MAYRVCLSTDYSVVGGAEPVCSTDIDRPLGAQDADVTVNAGIGGPAVHAPFLQSFFNRTLWVAHTDRDTCGARLTWAEIERGGVNFQVVDTRAVVGDVRYAAH